MPYEPASTAAACSWIGLFAAVWSARNAVHASDNRDTSAAQRRRLGRTKDSSDDNRENDRNSTPVVDECNDRRPEIHVDKRLSTTSQHTVDGCRDWVDVDLFPETSARPGSRFDGTVAHPIDTPRRLDATIGAVGRRLRALPAPDQLGHRSILYRAQLQRIQRDAVQARARLATGTYGVCIDCTSPISLATLSEKPWTPVCIYCALDI